MDRAEYLYKRFLSSFEAEPTTCQDKFFREAADFCTCDDADILVVNGYAGTGKTTAVSNVVSCLHSVGTRSILLAPTGRAAKVLSQTSGRSASTIHKHIYRQKGVGSNGYGQFTLAPNKAKCTLFVVDEASLIGIDGASEQSSLFGTGNLLGDLIDFVRSGDDCRLLLMGDCAQLPPVGLDESPALSKDYMDMFGGVRYCSLTTVVRQASESGILHNATMIRSLMSENALSGDFSSLKLDLEGFDDIERLSGGDLIETLSSAYSRYGEDETVVLCRSNKRAIRYNLGIRSMVHFKEERLLRDDKLMIVKNCYQFIEGLEGVDYLANGDIAKLVSIHSFEQRYGLNFATATLSLPDYGDQSFTAKMCLDALESETASLSYEQSNALFQGVWQDYSDLGTKKKIWAAVREDKYFNALQVKYADALTCHKSQGGQWDCVFIDNPFWQELSVDDLKWLYTALTRAVKKVYLVNFQDKYFK